MAKEILIDGVDVSGCVKIGQYKECRACPTYQGINFNGYEDCDKWQNCYYKQLKRKEQECEKLKAENEELKKRFEETDKAAHELLQDNADYAWENKCYRQALDSVEDEMEWLTKHTDFSVRTMAHRLLDIIKKAKGEE